jgi:hypothetical protein
MQPQLVVTATEIQQLLREVAFTRNYGFSLQAIADGACTLNVPFQAGFERPGGMVSVAARDVAERVGDR